MIPLLTCVSLNKIFDISAPEFTGKMKIVILSCILRKLNKKFNQNLDISN